MAGRLSINIGEGVQKALLDAMEADGIDATEAIRRAVSVWQFVREKEAEGYTFGIIGPDGTVREVLFP